MNEQFLPIGTVVLLKNAKKRLMITGFCMIDKTKDNKMYDYCGCLYPEGLLSSNQTALFNHNQINKIIHMGLVDDEEKKFKKDLNEMLKEKNK